MHSRSHTAGIAPRSHGEPARRQRPSLGTIRALLDMSSDLVMLLDATRLALIEANPTSCRLLGYRRRRMLSLQLANIVASEHRASFESAVRQAWRQPGTNVREATVFERRDGSELPLETAIECPTDSPVPLAILVGRDVTQRSDLQQLLTRPWHLDPLTGLPNRTVLESRLHEAVIRKNSDHCALLMVDIDHFKRINDEWGHLAGDRVLKAVADRLASAVRAGDLVVRYGGDEFVLIVDPVGGEVEACTLADRVLCAIQQPIRLCGRPIGVSASIGVALAKSRRTSAVGLLARADQAMYRAKSLGRGRYEIARLPRLTFTDF